MKRSIQLVVALCPLLTLLVSSTSAQDDSPSAEQVAFFETKIRPALVEHCYRCHSKDANQIRGGLLVDTRSGLERGGDTGPAIVPGSLDESLLWDAINHFSYEMPPNRMMPESVINDFEKWILMGAPDPRVESEAVVINTQVTPEDIAEGKEFWSFKQPRTHTPPVVQNANWIKADLDRFVLSRLEQNGLTPSSDADPETLLRRICFDLVGLPPTTKQQEAFLAAYERNADRAIERLVDSLLESPQFGERWGRHWLDVARYAESSGKELNATFPHAWRYRDYVIDSFNNDKPYDEFIREQIAGDLLPAETDEEWTEHLVATGFLAMGPKTLTERDPRQFNVDLIDEQIDTTTRVVLGVSVACARCHDHKFDPIPQTDYYAIAGIFQSTLTYYGTLQTQQNRRPEDLILMPVGNPNPYDEGLTPSELADLRQQLEEVEEEYREANQLRRLVVSGRAANIPDAPGPNDPRISFQRIGRLGIQVSQLKERINSVDEQGRPKSFLMGVQESMTPRNARVLVRGEVDQPAQEVARGYVQVLDHGHGESIRRDSSGRLELAHWMTDEQNPLTARVMVNRIWQHLLGNGIVRTPEDFGSSGQAPSHPELLDYLAVEFMNQGWSIKTMIREIVTSHTYRMASSYDSQAFAIDPENKLLWRANSRRLDAEELRDAMLAIGGNLELERPRSSSIARLGHTIYNERLVAALRTRDQQPNRRGRLQQQNAGRGGFLRPNSDEADRYDESTRRSVYLSVVRDHVPSSLQLFDFAESNMVVGKRDVSNTASQALYLLNNDFVIEQSNDLARRLIAGSGQLDEQIDQAFQLIYGRNASDRERELAKDYYYESAPSRSRSRATDREALSNVCQALFASAEFRYLD